MMSALLRLTLPALAAAAFTLAPAAALAADKASATMTLPDAVAYAIDHSSTVASQRAALTQAQHALALQSGVAWPTVNGTLQSFLAKSANFQGTFAAIGAAQQNVVSQNTASVGFNNWNLTTGGFAFLTLAANRTQAEQARNSLANAEDQIASSVTNSFYGIVQKQAIVAVDTITLDAQNVLVAVAVAKEKAGVAAGVDVLQAKTSAAKSESSLVADKAAVEDASEALAQQIGAPLNTRFDVPKDVPQPPIPKGNVDSLVAIADANRPDVAAAREGVLADRYTRRGWNVELYPQISLSASIGNQFSPTSAVQEQLSNEQLCRFYGISPCPGVSRGSPGFWSLQAISTFSLPLVDYNARHSERVNDDTQLASAQTSFTQTRLQAELDVRQSYRAAQTAQSQLTYAKQESDYGTESARIAQLQYKAGVKTIYDVLQAQLAAEQALDDYVNARVNYVDAIVKLRVSLGTYDARTAVMDLK
ncbi:MAG TPA: TolC family protein [Candidatus Baltobacteraceae bacterium]|jgi:outer membrane protein|nr:TolC family protein [Candidatus Baltobacteraceae bacterium]